MAWSTSAFTQAQWTIQERLCYRWHSHSWLCRRRQDCAVVAQALLPVAFCSLDSMTFYRRNLPHWYPEGKSIFLTWRLSGSLRKGHPGGTAILGCAEIKHTGKRDAPVRAAAGQDWGRTFLILDAELDRGRRGPLWLGDSEIAGYVEDAIIRGAEREHYDLHAYVVMPNHVHVLLDPWLPLSRITGGIKGVSARDANAALGRIGKPFWQDESFDHWMRSEIEFHRIRSYIERNPVAAGLVKKPEEWPWSSAARKPFALRELTVRN